YCIIACSAAPLLPAPARPRMQAVSPFQACKRTLQGEERRSISLAKCRIGREFSYLHPLSLLRYARQGTALEFSPKDPPEDHRRSFSRATSCAARGSSSACDAAQRRKSSRESSRFRTGSRRPTGGAPTPASALFAGGRLAA